VRALALQVVLPKAHTLPVKALPSILIVVETKSKVYDSNKAEQDLRDRISHAVAELKCCTTTRDATRDLALSFQAIEVIGIQSTSSQRARTLQLSDRLVTLHDKVRWPKGIPDTILVLNTLRHFQSKSFPPSPRTSAALISYSSLGPNISTCGRSEAM
jgi:hypothetical protein